MQEGDPIDFKPRVFGHTALTMQPIVNLDIVIAYEEDLDPILHFQQTRDLAGLLHYLERGRVNRLGDGLRPAPLRKT